MISSFHIKQVRWSALFLGLSNLFLMIISFILIIAAYPDCAFADVFPLIVILLVSCLRISTMIPIAIAQRATALTIVSTPTETRAAGTLIRRHQRIRYKKWIRWTRIAFVITVLQFLAASYLLIDISKLVLEERTPNECILGLLSTNTTWLRYMVGVFIIMVCVVTLIQCFSGSDVLRWRSFYTNENKAWKRHYREVFDHGLREALCCLGRFKYLTVMEEDEVFSVAQLLGDLVSYRASGKGHLELLAGLALLRRESLMPKVQEETIEAPEELIQGAVDFHRFAEAAYTGPLLDVGRNPILFLCAWLYRQGVMTPWARKRLPKLKGDNWWRGHARAFLKYVNLPADSLRQGRVCQTRCEAAYFVVVLHDIKSVVICVRGTETPEDLLTDGLSRECLLATQDIDGLIYDNLIPPGSTHYGHSGIVESARDLYEQIDGNSENKEFPEGRLLTSLLGAGCECEEYNLRIVGHSLGGAIAAMLGLKLYGRYPRLHVYSYGPLPCVDSVLANACSGFVTSIVYDNEFSSRLSVASIMRLQTAAMLALTNDADADSAIMHKLARRFLSVTNYLWNKHEEEPPASGSSSSSMRRENKHDNEGEPMHVRIQEPDEDFNLWDDMDMYDSSDDHRDVRDPSNRFSNPFYESSDPENSRASFMSQFMQAMPSRKDDSSEDFREMFLPGTVIHIIPENNSFHTPLYKRWATPSRHCGYEAYVANREAFMDIIVSPVMFIDHLPWRCSHALKKILEKRKRQRASDDAGTGAQDRRGWGRGAPDPLNFSLSSVWYVAFV
ncbi:putative fungal lipase-like domain, alpha/Beta hydrolase [Helianthus annuus]|nr:putative fungal lipase-like domain, alpha/Beta hydrolase [Helianthus annuus]